MKSETVEVPFKEYPRKYKYFYSNLDWVRSRSKISWIKISDEIEAEAEDVGEYVAQFKKLFNEYEKMIFSATVDYVYLLRKFSYHGHKVKENKCSGLSIDRAFTCFIRLRCNHFVRAFTNNNVYVAVASYVKDFFPNLAKDKAAGCKFENPYKFMNLECLYFVYRMSERLKLLEIGEKQKMNAMEFFDYVINYVQCYNEEHGKTYCLPALSIHSSLPCIRLQKHIIKYGK